MNSAAFAVSAAVYQKLPYDPLKDFAPVSQVAAAPIVVVVAPSLGVKSIKDLIALAKAQPGQINFLGSSGVGSSTHFAGEQFKLAAGLNVVHVPYKGPSEALLDTSTGRILVFPVAAGARIAVHQRREIARFWAMRLHSVHPRCQTCQRSPRLACPVTSIRTGGACSHPPRHRVQSSTG